LGLSGSTFESAIIYYSDPSAHDSYHLDSQLNIKMGESYYSIGDPVAGVQPDVQQSFQNIITIRPQTWTSSGQYFAVSFPLDAINGSGLYTIAIWVNNTLPIKNPYDPSRYQNSLPVLEYAIKLP